MRTRREVSTLTCPPCLFCSIVQGVTDAAVVYRDDLCIVFMDASAINAGHMLVVPLCHAESLASASEQAVARMMVVARKLTSAIRRGFVTCEGVSLLLADGRAAGQELAHLHLHVLPRYTDDGFSYVVDRRGHSSSTMAKIEVVAESIRKAIQLDN